ncbi:hypothetical protein FAM09_01245 [Niastella caeni]|uniref:Uncharacterized protein n=1 Tax=Niastella caeni TaxID=2569763 RepID=A0A4S8HY95_9BACT|nr:hypothetical protein [Niastella caeni]THU40768.1 hypothetical protein FAM09_01245 [Niastella caeni]
MKEFVKKITPGFLFKLDNRLIRSKPLLWASRLHFLIYYELLLLAFNISISIFQPIGFTNIPNTLWLLIYGIASNLVLIICWIYYQVLLDIIYFQSKRIRFLNWRIASLYSAVFLFISFSAIFPYMILNRRIVNIFNDNHFPEYQRTFSGNYNYANIALVDSAVYPTIDTASISPIDTASSIDTFYTKRSHDYYQLARIQKKYDGMNSEEKFNILVSLREIDFVTLEELSLDNYTSTPYIQYRLPYYNLLTIYYNYLIKNDSFTIKKFDITVYQRQIKARIGKRDTIIERYYFLSRTTNQFIICDRADILQKLVEYKIDDAFRTYSDGKITKQSAINQVFDNYEKAVSYYRDRIEIFHASFFIGSALAIAILVCTAFIRLLGTKAFAIGSIIVTIIAGILFALINYSGYGDREDGDDVTLSLFTGFWIIGSFIYLLGNRKSATNIILLFVGTCSIAIGNWILPILGYEFLRDHLNIPYKNNDQTMYIQCWSSLILLFIFAGIFVRKLQKIYCQPGE